MSQRDSGYAKKAFDYYPSPAWVVTALAEHVKLQGTTIWECACGTGDLCEALRKAGASNVLATDVHDHGYKHLDGLFDFTAPQKRFSNRSAYHGIVTNPPFGERGKLAEQFIERGLDRLDVGRFMALLLPVDFDSAVTRLKFFDDNPHFAGSIHLTKRPKWFDEPLPCKKCGGSEGVKGSGKVDGETCKSCGGKGEKKSGPSSNSAWFIWHNTPLLSARGRPIKMYAPSVHVPMAEAA